MKATQIEAQMLRSGDLALIDGRWRHVGNAYPTRERAVIGVGLVDRQITLLYGQPVIVRTPRPDPTLI